MKTLSLAGLLLCAALIAPAQISLQLELISDVFNDPVDLTNAGDDRLFIVEKGGLIRILATDGQVNGSPYLDIDDRVRSSENERGLLGLAFHPDYAENGFFFVNYTNNSGNTVVARYQVSDSDPDIADPESEKILLTVTQPFNNHNGGDLNFGPDGYLYIGLGDGGSGGDPRDKAQTRQDLLGKMLRIDVDNGDPYGIPADNPFVNTDETLDEIWALGLRNPWRFSFDRLTGDLWIGDVGQGNWEEVDFQPANSSGGENYGWRCYEGDATYNTDGCGSADNYVFPVYAYESNDPNGCSITGGFVYRGDSFPLLFGKYLFTDYCSGKIWMLEQNESENWVRTELLDGTDGQYVSFGEGADGELYLVSIEGAIFQVRDLLSSVAGNRLDAQLQLLPNPFVSAIWIQGSLPEKGRYRMRLFDARGRVVWESAKQLATEFQEKIETENLARGLYFFQLERNGASWVTRVVRQ